MSDICPDCTDDDHQHHKRHLGRICVGCACDWTPPDICTCPDRGDGWNDDLCPVHAA